MLPACSCPWIACGKKMCAPDEIEVVDHDPPGVPGCNLARCKAVMQARGEYAFELLEERIEEAIKHHRQLIVITHYPTTWFDWWMHPRRGRKFTDLLSNPRVHIAFFGGHVHATDNVTNVKHGLRRHGWNDYCVGGGGESALRALHRSMHQACTRAHCLRFHAACHLSVQHICVSTRHVLVEQVAGRATMHVRASRRALSLEWCVVSASPE